MPDLLQRIRHGVHAWIWATDPATVAPGRRRLIELARLAHAVGRDLVSGAITLRAMSLVFTTLLALVPLIAVSFSVLKGFGVHNRIEPVLYRMLAPLGPRADEVTERLVGFVDNIKVGVLGAVGIGLLLYTAVSLVQKIEEAFNYTWNVARRRTLVRRFSDYFSVLAIGPVLVFTALGITASLANSAVVQRLSAIEPFGSLIQVASALVPYVLIVLAFTFVYMLIPNTRVRFSAAFAGAAVAGIAWESLGRVFATFVATSSNYTAIYSGFAILLLFMIWLYVSWLIVLTGSSVAFYWQHPAYARAGGRTATALSPAAAERLALEIVGVVVRAWYKGEAPPPRERLGQSLGAPVQALDRVLADLVAARLLARTGDESPGYLPASPPDRTGAKHVLDAVRGVAPAGTPATGRVTAAAEAAVERALRGYTLADLARDPDPQGVEEAPGVAGGGG